MLDLLEDAYNENVIDIEEYNAILEAMREAEQRVFKNYDEIKKELDTMVNNTLELKSFKMRDEAVNEATMDMLRQMKKSWYTYSKYNCCSKNKKYF